MRPLGGRHAHSRVSHKACIGCAVTFSSHLSVAHVIASVAEEATGPAYTVPALCDALAGQQARVELHVLGSGPPGEQAQRYELWVHRREALLRAVDASRDMRQCLAAHASALDVFHTHGLWRMPGLYAASVARRRGKPIVTTPRGMLEPAALRFSRRQKRVFWAVGQGRALREADCLHATSDGELQTIRALGLRNPVAVIPNGVHMPNERGQTERRADRTLLYLGRLHPIKALDRLIAAWASLEPVHHEWNLRIVGPCAADYRAELQAQCDRAGIRRVSFGGAVFGPAKQAEYERAELYVLPSHSENFGMTLAEALAGGVPVVASRGTPWSAVELEGCGRWVDNSSAALAAGLSELLHLPHQELSKMGARGRRWMERDFSWSQKAAEMLAVYRWLGDRRSTPPPCVDQSRGTNQRRRAWGDAWAPPW